MTAGTFAGTVWRVYEVLTTSKGREHSFLTGNYVSETAALSSATLTARRRLPGNYVSRRMEVVCGHWDPPDRPDRAWVRDSDWKATVTVVDGDPVVQREGAA